MRLDLQRALPVLLAALLLPACASYEGMADASRTLATVRGPLRIRSLAVVGIDRDLGPRGFAEKLEVRLQNALRRDLPAAKVLAPNLYARKSPRQRPPLVVAVRDVRLRREKIPTAEATARCDFAFCWGPKPPHVWRSRVEVLAELRYTPTGALLWRGIGGARYDYPGERSLRAGVAEAEGETVASLERVALDLVDPIAESLARQISGLAAPASSRR
jgi:hypothetical protein